MNNSQQKNPLVSFHCFLSLAILYLKTPFTSILSISADIYDQVASGLSALGLTTECVGGGRILHVPNEKKLFVYGYSMVVFY